METKYKVSSESRLHWQLLHACLRARQRQSVQEVFELMIKRHGAADAQELSKLLRACVNFNMLDLALQLITVSFSSGSSMSGKDLQAVVDAALKKKKPSVADRIVELAAKRGLHLRK